MKHDFKYISKNNKKVKQNYNNLITMLNELQDLIRDSFTFQYSIVGSYKRNMITYDAKSNAGYDFDFNSETNEDPDKYDAKQVKHKLINGLRKIVKDYGYDYPEDSTRVITIKKKEGSNIITSCDLCIVYNYTDEDGYDSQKYIHFNKKQNSYSWQEQGKGYYMLPDKIDWLKEEGLWGDVRERYIDLKNKEEDPNVHSRTSFAIAIHEICQKYGYYEDYNEE